MVAMPLDEEAIFKIAAGIPAPETRNDYLQQACGHDEALLYRVRILLRAHDESPSFLEASPLGIAPTALIAPPFEKPGTQIGPYRLLEQIGEGGMGIVFMARQTEPVKRTVALKVIKPGMDSKQVIARFEAERQALAMMDHPNIARIYDAGTVEGASDLGPGTREGGQQASSLAPSPEPLAPNSRPFFVMELVRGVPITEYCDQQRLNTKQRLQLFLAVCQAVQHAHLKGIIHRDLKPSNVLVTLHDGAPVVKVIDFGVAKALNQELTERTLFTQFSQMIGTPLYMSPEQAELSGLDIDTRSDVYSLGVLLYELLTGTTPFDKDRLKSVSFDELRRIIREEEPETVSARIAKTRRVGQGRGHRAEGVVYGRRPTEVRSNPQSEIRNPQLLSTPRSEFRIPHSPLNLQSAIRNPQLAELDWIVMKAIEKDRSRRYESASALAADIQRYLSDEPVLACPPTTMYRFQKFARKHTPALVTAAAIAVCLLLGTTVSAWQAVRATTAEAEANENANQAQENAKEATEQRDEAQRQRDEVRALHEKQQATQARLERTLYAAHMNLAQHAWDAGAAGRVSDLLNQHRPQAGQPDLRGFEWRYLDRLCHGEQLTLKGHKAVVWSVAFSPDGKRVASASYDGTVKVWDAETGREHLSLPGRTEPWSRIARVAFTSDGRRLAGAGPEQTVKVWDADSGAELLSVKSSGQVAGISFSPDGKRLAHAAGEDVQVWDANNGQSLFTLKGHTTLVGGVAFSPDGRQIASVSRRDVGRSIDGQLRIWDASTGQELFSPPGPNQSWDTPVVFSADGQQLACNTRDGVKIWNPKTGAELRTLRERNANGRVLGLAFTPDGKRLAVSTFDGFVRIWDAQRGEELFMLKGISGPGLTSQDVAYSPDGHRLAVTGLLNIKIYDVRSPQEFVTIPEAKATAAYPMTLTPVFSPDGKRLIGAAGNDLKVWDTLSLSELLTLRHDEPVRSVAISPDNKWIASGTGTLDREGEVKIWNASTGAESHRLKTDGPVFCVTFSPDSKELAASYGDRHRVKIWDPVSGQELRMFPHIDRTGDVVGLDYSSDGKRILTVAYSTGGLRIWNASDGTHLLKLKADARTHGSARDGAFSPDGKRLASAHGSHSIRIWDAQTGEELMLLKGHASSVDCVTFSPDGKRLASASDGDNTVKIWDTQTGDELLSIGGYPAMFSRVAFSPDGNLLATTGPDKTIRLWDATPLPEKP